MLDAGERLSRAWGIVGHLHSVNDVPPWREAYNAMLPEVSSFYADLGQNLALFARYKALSAGTEFPTLSPARRRIIENELRDFRLSGAELPEDAKGAAKVEADKVVSGAKAEIEQEVERAKQQLRERVAELAVAGAEKILRKEINASVHADMLGTLKQDL